MKAPPKSIRGKNIHQKHFLATLVHQEPVQCSKPFHNNDSYPSTACTVQTDSTRLSANAILPTRTRSLPKNRYRNWISCRSLAWVSTNSPLIWPFPHLTVLPDSLNLHGGGMTATDTPSASERAYRAFPRTRTITARASGKWTTARHLSGCPLTNAISPTTLAWRMPFLGAKVPNGHIWHVLSPWVLMGRNGPIN